MEVFQTKAIIIALKSMYLSSHFSICTIDKCMKIANIKPKSSSGKEEIYDTLSVLHCVDWVAMGNDMKFTVMNKIAELLEMPDILDEILGKQMIEPRYSSTDDHLLSLLKIFNKKDTQAKSPGSDLKINRDVPGSPLSKIV